MKRFLLKLAAFGLIIAAVAILADVLLSRNMRSVNTYGMETRTDIIEGTTGSGNLIPEQQLGKFTEGTAPGVPGMVHVGCEI